MTSLLLLENCNTLWQMHAWQQDYMNQEFREEMSYKSYAPAF